MRVEVGMTQTQLEKMFGPGTEMSSVELVEMFGELEAERFNAVDEKQEPAPRGMSWKADDFSLHVLLVDDKVVAKAEDGKLKRGLPGAGFQK
jgi:hypothetical protein